MLTPSVHNGKANAARIPRSCAESTNAGHRLDAWITALAHRRLIALRGATPIGARGYELDEGRHALVCPLEDFGGRIRALLDDPALGARLAAEGRRLAETRYDWRVIAADVVVALRGLLADAGRSAPRRSAGG